MKGREGKRNRRESAIKQFEKIRKKKLERAELCLENTKKNLNR